MATPKKSGSAKAAPRGAAAKSAAKSAGKSATKSAAKAAAKGAGASKGAARPAAKAGAAGAAKGAAKAPAKRAAKAAAPAKSAAGKRGPNAAFMKPLQPDAQLGAVVGTEPMPRTQVVARVWEYIKKHNLQESRNIRADDKLRPIFGKDQITMFEMMKLVNAHLSDASA